MAAGFLTFTVALITSLAATVPVRQFAIRVGMVDRPGPRKIHLEPIPLLGGIAIYAAVILAVLVSYPSRTVSEILGILAGATLLLLVGTGRLRLVASPSESFSRHAGRWFDCAFVWNTRKHFFNRSSRAPWFPG